MTIYTGDCVEVMAQMDAASVDAIVTDPPYGLMFMGKSWDSFGGPLGVGHGMHRKGGREPGGAMKAGDSYDRSLMGNRGYQEWCETWAREALRITKPGGYLLSSGGTRTYHRLAAGIEDAGWIIRDCLVWAYASGFPKSKALLKPAWEPIVMARKPGPLRELAIDACRIGAAPRTTHGDGNHQGTHPAPGDWGQPTAYLTQGAAARWPANLILTDPIFDGDTPGVVGGGERHVNAPAGPTNGSDTYSGRWGPHQPFRPDDGEGTYSRFFLIPKADRAEREPVLGGLAVSRNVVPYQTQQRYCDLCGETTVVSEGLKCGHPRSEWKLRDGQSTRRANHHPTVKPLDLMRHLVRLVTPSGGVVLDPFLGSGTTALAAEMEGFPWIGIEKEPEYVAITEARLNGTQKGLGM